MRLARPALIALGAAACFAAAARLARSAPALSASPSAPAELLIDCHAPAHAISPLVYGIGYDPQRERVDGWVWELNPGARRWGGNATSRYNWRLGNAWNTGRDWYYRNVDYTDLPGPAWRRFLDQDAEHRAGSALTVPMLGWVARDTSSFSFPSARFGPQQAHDPDRPEAGNGVARDGAPLVPGSPENTSVRSTPESIGRWVKAIETGARGAPPVQLYLLDNEPTLWHETHRDVHPEPVGYDELLERTVAYANAVRAAAPEARIAGPALWGWTALFYSGRDAAAGFALHPDRRAHGGEALLPWYLRQLRARREGGRRLIDVVDVHFYPQGDGIGYREQGDTRPEASARRIRSTRALWDPDYVDESWIGEPVQLIPRIRGWIDAIDPGLGLAIGEYNFGAEGHMSSALALAEALGRFGQLGLDAAFYWTYPAHLSPAYWAFRAYRNFDGRGGRFLDLAVPAHAPEGISLFASRSPDREHLVAIALNLDPRRDRQARVSLSGCGTLAARRALLYRGGPEGFEPTGVAARQGGFAATLPAYSITVFDVRTRAAAREGAAP